MTACISVAYDRTKLPLFLISKGQPGANIEKSLPNILPDGAYGCCQSNAWMDDRVMKIWIDKIWKPYVQNYGNSVFLLDDFACHKKTTITDYLKEFGSYIELIPGGYTCVLQPCGVGIMRYLKAGIKKNYIKWSSAKYSHLFGNEKLPVPNRAEVPSWISHVWTEFPEDCIRSTFEHIGYTNTVVTPPPTPYPAAPFPYLSDDDESDDENDIGNDVVGLPLPID